MKRYLAILLSTFILIMSITGCVANTQKSQSTDSNLTSEVSGKGNEDKKEEVYEFKMFANFNPVEQSDGDKALFEELERVHNVKVSFEVPPSTSYAERMQIMLAGGNYPDIVLFTSHNDKTFLDAVDNEVVISLNEYIENSPNIKKYSYDVSMKALMVKDDGKIYGIPRTSIARADGYFIRKDWLDNVNISIPQDGAITIDEFYNIMKAFTKNDPDKNGKDDTYGIVLGTDSQGNLTPIITNAFGMLGWQKYGDKYIDLMYSLEHDNYKKALEFTRKLWQEGLIDPDWPTVKGDIVIERFKQGVGGMTAGFAGWLYRYQGETQELNPKAELTYVTGVKNDQGVLQGPVSSTAAHWGFWGITTSAKKPDRIVKVLDWLLSDEGWNKAKYGIEGVTYNVADGKKVPTDLYPKYQWGKAIVRRNNDPEFFITLGTPGDMEQNLKQWIGICVESAVFTKDAGYRPAAADKPQFIDYQKTLFQTIAKIIVGELPVEAYDNALKGWYEAGGEEYVQQMNEFIKNNSN
jgi:putative aldouronate transport system substrate-binding protein